MPADRVTGKNPWHVMLVLDDSFSMSGGPAAKVAEAVEAMIVEMKLISSGMKPYFRVSIIQFGSKPKVLCEVKSELEVDLSPVTAMTGDSGSTDVAAALQEAVRILSAHPGEPTDFNPYVFFLSDGGPDDEKQALQVGQSLKSLAIAAGTPRVVTIGFGTVNDNFMRSLASNTELYKKLSSVNEIVRLFPQIGTIAQSQVGVAGVDAAIMNL